MRLSLPLALLLILPPALPAAATEAHGGHHASGMPFKVFRGGHHAFNHRHSFVFFPPSSRAARQLFVGPGNWGWGWNGGWDWGGGWGWDGPSVAGLADPSPGPAMPPPPPMRVADDRPSVEVTAQGVTIIRGPGSRHLVP